jgi:arsenate reductase
MAEAMVNAWADDRFEAFSAGTVVTRVRPETIAVMAELGMDLSDRRSKSVDEFRDQRIDRLITVCDEAAEACPTLPGVAAVSHWSIPDPSAVVGTPEERLAAFRAARDAIAERVRQLVGADAEA